MCPAPSLRSIANSLLSLALSFALAQLAYTKFKHVPLYLEWAPEGVIGATTTTTTMEVDETPPAPPAPAAEEEADEDEEDQGNVVAHSIFVKNLKFTTTEDSLSHFFEAIAPGKVTATKIPTKIAPEGSKAAGAVQVRASKSERKKELL